MKSFAKLFLTICLPFLLSTTVFAGKPVPDNGPQEVFVINDSITPVPVEVLSAPSGSGEVVVTNDTNNPVPVVSSSPKPVNFRHPTYQTSGSHEFYETVYSNVDTAPVVFTSLFVGGTYGSGDCGAVDSPIAVTIYVSDQGEYVGQISMAIKRTDLYNGGCMYTANFPGSIVVPPNYELFGWIYWSGNTHTSINLFVAGSGHLLQ